MKRFALFPVLLGLALPAGAAAASSAPSTSLKLSSCHSSLDLLKRSFDISAKMKTIPGTKRMGIRYDVLERRSGATGYVVVHAPSFGVWLLSKKGVPGFGYVRTVNGLEAPATYRIRAGYRWYGKGGKTLKTLYRLTGTCHQTDLRPDLRIRLITVAHGKKGHDRYAVVVRNTGRTAAGPFVLRLAFPGGEVRLWDLTGLASGASARRTANGAPACADGAPTATADAGGSVDESDEQNNTRVATCPAR